MDTKTHAIELIDLGDANTETKQGAPWPQRYVDHVFGLGSLPDS